MLEKKNNLMLKKVLSIAKATASLVPLCEAVPPGFLLLVLPRCVSVIPVDRAAPLVALMTPLQGQQTVVVCEGEQPEWTENIVKLILLLYLM